MKQAMYEKLTKKSLYGAVMTPYAGITVFLLIYLYTFSQLANELLTSTTSFVKIDSVS